MDFGIYRRLSCDTTLASSSLTFKIGYISKVHSILFDLSKFCDYSIPESSAKGYT
ncbi:hypothetical protein PORCAN_829 [Porphyromonas crevioricanis JCM 13913]|nr:hypothetical protein PORCAN_829 [Porphyromonas crevioricanis JCM 13913]